ncbi:hypothetical protein DFQ30_005000, partial [Apophysomyces sp. BC1015]
MSLSRHAILLDPLLQFSGPSEYDVAYKLWLPLFDCLFDGHPSISICIAETTNDYSANEKRNAYIKTPSSHDAPRTISFKIDIRFVYHCRQSSQIIDLAAVEAAALFSSQTKVTSDNAKLLREGKDVLDRLLKTMVEQQSAEAMKGFIIQLDGLESLLSTLHFDEGLYVVIPAAKM